MRNGLIALVACTSWIYAATGNAAEKPRWKKIDINPLSPFEGAGVADLNGDGKLDIFSGDSWYQAPRWTRHKVRDVDPGKNPHYHDDFADLPIDANGDGKPDFVTCNYYGKLVGWIKHPGDPGSPWTLHEIDRADANETCRLVDVNNDGKLDIVPSARSGIIWYELVAQTPEPKWQKHVVTKEGAGHGIGAGDINSDGRLDLIGPEGWYEQPGDPTAPWTFHAEFKLGKAGIMILGRDIDGDGLTDVVWGMGHAFGLFWLQQRKDEAGARAWIRREIDTTFSQAHTLLWADLDGKGEPALVTGKRIYSHEEEPGATDAPVIYAFRFNRKTGTWIRETIYQGEAAKNAPAQANDRAALTDFARGSAGTGLQIEVADIDHDGDVDLVCPGKTGLYLFENLRIPPKRSAARKR